MCAGAISAARLKRVVYGATDIKGGALESGVRFFETKFCNHKPLVQSGILAHDSSIILKKFFQIRRKKEKNLD
jgi:tRNA(Arg) A34 adenosine deaminase TadA